MYRYLKGLGILFCGRAGMISNFKIFHSCCSRNRTVQYSTSRRADFPEHPFIFLPTILDESFRIFQNWASVNRKYETYIIVCDSIYLRHQTNRQIIMWELTRTNLSNTQSCDCMYSKSSKGPCHPPIFWRERPKCSAPQRPRGTYPVLVLGASLLQ